MSCRCCECNHGEHNHEHHHESENYLLLIIKIIIGVVAFVIGHIFEDNSTLCLIITLVAYVFVSYDIFINAFKELKDGDVFNEYLLMIIATIGAFFIGEYHESLTVMLLFIIGEMLQGIAVDKSRQSIVNLVGVNKSIAHLKKNNEIIDVDPHELKKGDIVILKKGEMLTIDGKVVNGSGNIDNSNLTGETLPKFIDVNDEVISGSVNLDNVLEIEVVNEYKDSKINKTLTLVEDANDRKSKSDKIIRKIAKIYTPIVIALAILIIPIFTLTKISTLTESIYKSLSFLLISCPCAIVISVPITYFAAIGGASKRGVLIKGANFLDELYKVKNIAFDKTGTISEGKYKVSKVHINEGINKDEFIENMILAQSLSSHPIALSIKEYFKNYTCDQSKIKNVNEVAGVGMVVTLNDGKTLYSGKKKMMDEHKIECEYVDNAEYLAINGKFVGYIVVEDKIKGSSYEAMKSLSKYNKILLSEDNEKYCQKIANSLGINKYYCDLLPEEKMKILSSIIKDGKTMFVGGGVNDTLSISLADVSVSMGIRGSEASQEYSDVVISNGNLENIGVAFKYAHKTRRLILENLICIMLIKIVVMFLILFASVPMWLAVFSDAGLCILSIINSMRANTIHK